MTLRRSSGQASQSRGSPRLCWDFATTAWFAVFTAFTGSLPVFAAEREAYPARPIRIVAPNSAGSGADVVTRLVANRLTEAFGRQVVVDNRAGASGAIGTEIVARSAPDGYTLLMTTSQQAVVQAMYEKPTYDLMRDFSGIVLLASTPLILAVHPGVAATSVRELISVAKAKPGQLNYASPGAGTTSHLATELFKSMTATHLLHVPYKGTTQALSDTISGEVQVTLLVATALLPSIKAGRVRALAITSPKRSALAPELPAIAESVPGYEWGGWYGLATPRGTPAAIIARLNAEQLKALKTAEFQERLAALGAEPLGSTPQEFEAHMRTQVEKMRVAIRLSGARPE